MPLTGDFSLLLRIQQALDRAALVPRDARANIADEFRARLEQQYRRGVGPDDQAWKPVTEQTLASRKVKKSPPPLTDTGTMRANSRATVKGISGIRVSITRPKTPKVPKIHQATRPLVPVGTLPTPWRRAVEKGIRMSIERYVRIK